MHTHSEDAHRLLANLTKEPAYVFGSSSGAVIGLDLCIRHPEQVQLLIPHEPVLLQLLSENELKQAINFMEDLKGNHQSEVMKLLSNIDDSNSEPSKEMLTERLLGNSMYFTEYEIGNSQLYFKYRCIKVPIKTCIDTGTSSWWKYFKRNFPLSLRIQLSRTPRNRIHRVSRTSCGL